MATIPKNCLNCNKEFQAQVKEVNRGGAKYCSRSCSASHNRKAHFEEAMKPNAECAYCHVPLYRNNGGRSKSRSGLFFCSRDHKDLAQRLSGVKEFHPRHYGTRTGNSPGTDYRNVAFRNLPHKCNMCEYNKHPSLLVVHHIDRDRANNRLENLEILCPTCHAEIHYLNKDGWFTKNKVVAPERIELPTNALSKHCSTTELKGY